MITGGPLTTRYNSTNERRLGNEHRCVRGLLHVTIDGAVQGGSRRYFSSVTVAEACILSSRTSRRRHYVRKGIVSVFDS